MKLALIAACAALICAPAAHSQKLDLRFDALAGKASAKTELDLDGKLLHFLVSHLEKDDEAAGLLAGVQAIHIRTYEFAKPGEFSDKDLEGLRKQVSGGGRWSRVLNVKEKDESSEVHLATQGDKVTGCLIISAEERELNVVYLEGSMGLAQMKDLGEGNVKDRLAAILDLGKE